MVMLSRSDTRAADASPGFIESEHAAFLGENLNTIPFSLPPSLTQTIDAVVDAAQAGRVGDLG